MHCGKTSSKSRFFIAFIVYCIYFRLQGVCKKLQGDHLQLHPRYILNGQWWKVPHSLQYVHLNPRCALSSHCLTALCVVKAAVLQQQPAQLAQLSWPSAGSREVAPSCCAPVTVLTLTRVRSRAANVCFTISWLKATNSTFTFKTLLRHYAKCALTQSK